jgi:mono/diheme cytochrome c family protein
VKKSLLLIMSTAIAGFSASAMAGERVGDFALIDHLGAQHHMAWYDDQRAVVILPQGVDSTDAAALDALQDLRARYEQQGVSFFLLNPGLQTDREAVVADLAELGVELPVLMDDTHLVTEALGVTRMDEVVVYDPSSFEISYRGPIQAATETAITGLLNGERSDLVAVAGTGSVIANNIAEHASLSYVNDIAPIIAENCAECHREGGIAPFAMDSSLAVQGWSPMIREVVLTKRMPPGQIDNKVGHKMKNEMNLSDEEMQKLVRWVDAGSPVDGDEDPLTALTWPDTKWTLGEPDMIVKIPATTVPATGVVDYKDIVVDLDLDEERWVRGSEVAPGAPEVLHHIITTVVPPGGGEDPQALFLKAINSLPEERAAAIRAEMFAAVAAGEQPNIDKIFRDNPEIDVGTLLGGGGPDQASIAGYAPGNSVSLNPEGVGGRLVPGTKLSFQMHYTTSGKEQTDETEVGIYFYPEGYIPEERMGGGVGNAFTIAIPAGAKDHEMELVTYIKNDAEIHSLMPHMHFRGKRMKFTAVYPDGSEEVLLSVPAYSFNWQLAHELAEPLAVPGGTKIVATGAFDNSGQNPYNPDPTIEVNWGEQSWEEMFMGFYSWKELNQGGDD